MVKRKRILPSISIFILVLVFLIFIISFRDGQFDVLLFGGLLFTFTLLFGSLIGLLMLSQKQQRGVRHTSIPKITKYIPSIISIYDSARALLLREISLVAVSENGKLLAVGLDAIKEIESRGSKNHIIGSPLKNCNIADFDITRDMFTHLIRVAWPKWFSRPSIAVCSPFELTALEMRVFQQAILAGVKNAKVTIPLELTNITSLESPEKYTLIIEITPQHD